MKLCRTCNETRSKSEFGNRKASIDGLSPKCKECQKSYDKARLRDPKRMKMRRDYQKTESGKSAHSAACKRWVDKNLIKRAVHVITGNAIRSGALVKGPCEVCGSKVVNAHHDDYRYPVLVRWLCDIHHNEWHSENGEGKNAH